MKPNNLLDAICTILKVNAPMGLETIFIDKNDYGRQTYNFPMLRI
jgi:hypothetical protein